ncbi:hypothetical protein NDU88_001238 [Pleurodeles waltl]|uniref:Uncharacterized protein n=1 Tax=Pleurodeles waltl TaxID=8319 RepID=A0AAV7KRI5_PLEWA|nr:hypothetical protein NDU88_001238 [Pleurodeles waltl]
MDSKPPEAIWYAESTGDDQGPLHMKSMYSVTSLVAPEMLKLGRIPVRSKHSLHKLSDMGETGPTSVERHGESIATNKK